MESTVLTTVRPPAMVRRPGRLPLSRETGAALDAEPWPSLPSEPILLKASHRSIPVRWWRQTFVWLLGERNLTCASEGQRTPAGAQLAVERSDNIHAQATLLDTWNQHYCQLSSGAFDGSVTSLQGPGFRLFVESMNRAVLQRGDVGEGSLGFGIATRVAGHCNICGEEALPGDLLVFSGSEGFEFLSPDGFDFVGLEIRLVRQAQPDLGVLLSELDARLRRQRRAIRLQHGHSRALAEAFRQVLRVARCGDAAATGATTMLAMQRQLVGAVIDGLDASAPPDAAARAQVGHWALVKSIRQSVVEHPDCPLSVAELALRLGVSRRTLQNAVGSTLGISPVAFLRALRLSQTRREIATARSVTEIATRWGFWHFGYFARDYRAMFGELPSETLRRARADGLRAN